MPNVKPARWRGRYHWITIVRVETFHEEYLRDPVEGSHEGTLDSLAKRRRAAFAAFAAFAASAPPAPHRP